MASIAEIRARVRARIWQSVVQSGLISAGIPNERWEVLVEDLTTGVLEEVDACLDLDEVADAGADRQVSFAAMPLPGDEEEQLLWRGRPFLSLSERYEVTTQRVRVIKGFLSRDREDVELLRVQDIDHEQNLTERMTNLGDITIRSADPSHPQIILRNVKDPEEVHEVIRRAMLNARKKANFSFREEM
ncbi:MAG: PH domain-containing protein [Anaerolineae bacterium]